jgi:tetratricopeptide (TPR) repeat protein
MNDFSVKAWEENVSIPTYKVGEPDKNPMFLEKRVYQGSSGTVYPFAVIDKVYDVKEDKIYKAVFLENEYLKIMILPELGGRIQMAYDKTNNYHFVYYNEVIKPALVGLTGPWISGGIEFNWPQHHRPSTFEAVDHSIETNEDGSITVWVGEVERMFHTKGMAGFTLYPRLAYLEIRGKLYNRTPVPQTFLWWANPAVAVNENYQSVFPPDVNAVFDHGRRDVSAFPIATGTYYKVDYSPGTDISWYKNIPVPTSYMAVNSEFDFVGGYDHGKKAGLLHVADHHISPGKKQWTWGCGEFGKAWERQLTDESGPYIELMAGMFTDNQPDFGWIMPNEERNFLQYFLPYKNIGYVKNATIDACISLDAKEAAATVQVYVTAEREDVTIQIFYSNDVVLNEAANLSPSITYKKEVKLPNAYDANKLKAVVLACSGEILVSYVPASAKSNLVPEAARSIPEPNQISTNEGLYLAGLHLEQHRHATYSPVDYYKEALLRDPTDIRNNNALGLWYLKHGQMSTAENHFQRSVITQIKYNGNPYDGEILYNLGVALFYQNRYDEAYDSFYKAAWNAAWQDKCFLFLAKIEAKRGNYLSALEHIGQSVAKNMGNLQSRHLKAILLRKLKQLNQAEILARKSLKDDVFDFGAGNELYLILRDKNTQEADTYLLELSAKMRGNAHTFIEVAIDYAHAGFYEDAVDLLERVSDSANDPFLNYYLAYYNSCIGDCGKAMAYAIKGFDIPVTHVFCNRLEDIEMLQRISEINLDDYKCWYYLGNLWYDKRNYSEAIQSWEKSVEIFGGFATTLRNLGIAYYNQMGNAQGALKCYEKAFYLNTADSTVLFELDQLRKKMNCLPEERLSFLMQYPELLQDRDDLYLEYVLLHNLTDKHAEALSLIENRNFHPWEGGEGKASEQYVLTKLELAKMAYWQDRFDDAIRLLTEAQSYPVNLGEGKLFGAQENDIHYWLGCAYEKAGRILMAKKEWQIASTGLTNVSPAFFYNDQQPDKILYQGLALIKLENQKEANQRFESLVRYGEEHMNDEVKLDFFAVSLPDMMIFDDDLNRRNEVHCNYLIGLGLLGLGQLEAAGKAFQTVSKMDSGHLGNRIHRKMLDFNLSAM